MKSYKKLPTNDPVIRQIQNNTEQAITPILDKEIIDGIIVKEIELSTGVENIVNHKLGREPLGYIIVKKNANSVIWNSSINKRNIDLRCSANVTVNIWIF